MISFSKIRKVCKQSPTYGLGEIAGRKYVYTSWFFSQIKTVKFSHNKFDDKDFLGRTKDLTTCLHITGRGEVKDDAVFPRAVGGLGLNEQFVKLRQTNIIFSGDFGKSGYAALCVDGERLLCFRSKLLELFVDVAADKPVLFRVSDSGHVAAYEEVGGEHVLLCAVLGMHRKVPENLAKALCEWGGLLE